jgi:hypothetical protein
LSYQKQRQLGLYPILCALIAANEAGEDPFQAIEAVVP